MNEKKYHTYSVEAFLDDNYFIRYVKFNSSADVLFWEAWKIENSGQLDHYHLAVKQLKIILSDNPRPVPPLFLENLWTDIHTSIQLNERKKRFRRNTIIWTSAVAAMLILSVLPTWYFNSEITIDTAFGERKTINLNDGTEIRLNANSHLTMPRSFTWKKVRTVSLQGEAYFKVKHINQNPANIRNGESFQVTTPHLKVTVLGTTFNLKDRHSESAIALTNGKVSVQSLKSGAKMVITSGQAVREEPKSGKLILNPKETISPSTWIDGKMMLKQASVREIINAFQDLYGYKVILENPSQANITIDGSMSVKDENGVLFTLSNILNTNIKKEGKTIRLIPRR